MFFLAIRVCFWYNIFEIQSETIHDNNKYFVELFSKHDIIKTQSAFEVHQEVIEMSIGSTVKRLRGEKNITQEQLAEYLGITSRAVSQWECDRTSPDISQIPALCHIFDVSSDVLLEIDIERHNEEIQEYLSEANIFGESRERGRSYTTSSRGKPKISARISNYAKSCQFLGV